MAKKTDKDVAEDEGDSTSEAQIAVHWREEGFYFPPAKFIGQANASDPSDLRPFHGGQVPRMLPRVRRPARAGTSTGTPRSTRATRRFGSGSSGDSSTPATTALTAIWRRIATRPRSSGYRSPRRGPDRGDHLPGALRARERVRGPAPRIRGSEDRRRRRPSTCPWCPSCRWRCSPARASASSTPRSSAASRARRAAAASRTRRARSSSPWTATTATASSRSQGEGRRGGGSSGRRGRHQSRRCSSFGGATRSVRLEEPRWSKDATSSSTSSCRDYRGQDGRARLDASRSAALHHVHERHHGPPEGVSAQHRRLPLLRRPAPRSTTRTSIPRTPTGAPPTSAGSPGTPTSSTGRCHSARRRSCTRVCPTYPDAGRPGASPSGSG